MGELATRRGRRRRRKIKERKQVDHKKRKMEGDRGREKGGGK